MLHHLAEAEASVPAEVPIAIPDPLPAAPFVYYAPAKVARPVSHLAGTWFGQPEIGAVFSATGPKHLDGVPHLNRMRTGHREE